jgi:hypothetical protein
MAVAWTDLQKYVGALPGDEDTLTQCLDAAEQLVTDHVGGADALATVPETVRDEVLLEVGSKLWARRTAPYVTVGETAGGGPIPARDPLVTVYPILAKYVATGL